MEKVCCKGAEDFPDYLAKNPSSKTKVSYLLSFKGH